jgi:hypothetical protein
VCVKPFPVVVFRKRVEKLEEFRCEHGDFSQNWPPSNKIIKVETGIWETVYLTPTPIGPRSPE